MATNTTFQNMLNEVVKAPNESRSRKFLKLIKAGMTEAEANNILDQVALFEDGEKESNDIYLDSKDAKIPDSRTVGTAPKAKKTKSKLSKKLRL